ncbi:phage holin family protein [Campylobacter sp. LR286c]|uniref:phage holin family protein n=1 Tax=Campylobacter sp. LR286c TaxID=2593545 RepID=UPI001CC1EFDD|nr:phage holin family protein [Campylobacter sp. LR286c]
MNIEAYIELLPILVVGLICGLFKFINDEKKVEKCELKKNDMYINFLKVVSTSSMLCIIIYMILTAIDLSYLAKVGIASAFSFLGLDKAINLVRDILNLKKERY